MEFGTINGIHITQQMLDEYALEFEKDWDPSEFKVMQTERGKALKALNVLNIPSQEIEALERVAKHMKIQLSGFIHAILQNAILDPRFNNNNDEFIHEAIDNKDVV